MAKKSMIPNWLRHSLAIAGCLAVFVSCGSYEASHHPDESFRYGQGLNDAQSFGTYFNGQNVDPRFRRARVTTESSSLRLKTQPRSDAPAPTSGPTSIAKNAEVDVFWPLDVNNNHVKVQVSGRALWVTYRSSSGQEYVTLLEDIYVPQTHVPSSGSFNLAGTSFGPSTGSSPSPSVPAPPTSGGGFLPADLERISLTSSQISAANTAIRNVNLTPTSVAACSFDPIVGNNAGNNCYREIVISSDFRNFVAQHGQQCAVTAAREAFGMSATKVLFHSSGAGQVTSSRRVSGGSGLSTHATGQAFDLMAITVYAGSTSRKVLLRNDQVDGSSATERQNHSFYWSFANCWRGRVANNAPCAGGCGSRVGALTYSDNSAHHDHLHMSMPMCNREAYNVSCI